MLVQVRPISELLLVVSYQQHETPAEYASRLQAMLQKPQTNLSSSQQQEILIALQELEDLTQAYMQERYSGQKVGPEQEKKLHRSLLLLLRILTHGLR